METLQKPKNHPSKPKLIVDESLKERFGDKPLFPEKIEKAKTIMAKMRKYEKEKQDVMSIADEILNVRLKNRVVFPEQEERLRQLLGKKIEEPTK